MEQLWESRPVDGPDGFATAAPETLVVPLFLALGAPVTLALRTLPARPRRWLLALLAVLCVGGCGEEFEGEQPPAPPGSPPWPGSTRRCTRR